MPQSSCCLTQRGKMAPPRQALRPHETNLAAGPAPYATAKAAVNDLSTEAKVSPPKPARSAFMCFSDAKYKEIAAREGKKHAKSEMIKLVAAAWRELSDQERAFWDEEARDDKLRFVREKAAYKGPWEIPKRRAKKHPLAPKRPMSAFLKYSQTRRSVVKKENPDLSNTDVSRLLGEMWRSASQKERAPYVEQEEVERALYKQEIARWKSEQARLDAASRTSHQNVRRLADYPQHRQDERIRDFPGPRSHEETRTLHDEYRLAPAEAYQVPYPSYHERGQSYSSSAAPPAAADGDYPLRSTSFDSMGMISYAPPRRYLHSTPHAGEENETSSYFASSESYFGRYR